MLKRFSSNDFFALITGIVLGSVSTMTKNLPPVTMNEKFVQ